MKEIKTRLLACLPRDKFNSITKLLNEKEEKKYSFQQNLLKDLPFLTKTGVEYLAINLKYNPDTPRGQVEPKNQRN